MHESLAWTREQILRALASLQPQLTALDWSHGLTRDDLRATLPDLPQALYLHMPASKRFSDSRQLAQVIIDEMQLADAEAVEVSAENEALALGGPPAWGADPLLGGTRQESGSATDTQGLDQTNDQPSGD